MDPDGVLSRHQHQGIAESPHIGGMAGTSPLHGLCRGTDIGNASIGFEFCGDHSDWNPH